MMNLLFFLSIYLTSPLTNTDVFYHTKCENQKEYILYHNSNTAQNIIQDNNGNNLFTGIIVDNSDNNYIKDFYCYNNKLYAVIPEMNEYGIFTNISLYLFKNESFIRIDSITSTLALYSKIINNNLIYYDNYNKSFNKIILKDNLNEKIEYGPENDYNLNNIFYFPSLDKIVYLTEENGVIKTINQNGITENIGSILGVNNLLSLVKFNQKWYFTVMINDINNTRKIKIMDSDGNTYYSLTLENNEFYYKDFIFVNEYGIYNYLLLNSNNSQKLRLISIPNFISNDQKIKEISDGVNNIYKDNNDIYYLENNSSTTKINLIKGIAGKPNSPIVENSMVGVLNDIPANFNFSNFDEDLIYFDSYQFDIASNENFNSVYHGGIIKYYNKNSSYQVYQFYNNFILERDKPYYMRIRYNSILTSSEYSYIRFIITDLGEIISFKISDKSSDSTIYTNDETVKINLEKTGKIELLQLSLNSDFKNNGKDIAGINYKDEFNFIIPSEEKEYTYYIRPVIFDYENFIGGHQVKTAKIILDKTPPSKPIFITDNDSIFNKDNIKIIWKKSNDNLSGLKQYKIRLVNSLNDNIEEININHDENLYIPNDKNLKNDIYTVFISSCDNALNCSQESKINFSIVDKKNLKPYKPTLIRPRNKDIINSMPFNISWNESNDPENDKVTYSLVIAKDINFTQKEFESYLIENLSIGIKYLSEGHYYLKLFAVDIKGNESDYEIIEFDIIQPKNSKNSSGCSF